MIARARKLEVVGCAACTAATKLRRRVRELGIKIGRLETGEQNSITDVPGVSVGHVSLIRGKGKLCPGKGQALGLLSWGKFLRGVEMPKIV